jgi:ribosome biogenesis GTPase A
VDVVLEVRDARIPLATHHPQIHQWIGSKEKVLILNRMDMIPPQVRQDWGTWLRSQEESPCFTDAQQGTGIDAVKRVTQAIGEQVNRKRRDRGMLPRPVRAAVLGFPNVGKSALINRLVNRRVVESARRPGVTRQLRWVRISDQIELLDAPGVLPSKLNDQQAAVKLAICEDIGEAAYDYQQVASTFVDLLTALQTTEPSLFPVHPVQVRYELAPVGLTGEAYLQALAEQRYQGDKERTAKQILNDFRKGLLGAIALELPPQSAES